MNAAGIAVPAGPEAMTGTLKSSAVSGAAAVAMQKNSAGSPSASRLRIVVRPSGVTTSTVAGGGGASQAAHGRPSLVKVPNAS